VRRFAQELEGAIGDEVDRWVEKYTGGSNWLYKGRKKSALRASSLPCPAMAC
jgi:hypothetical protein